MAVRRWNQRTQTAVSLADVDEVVGVYELLTRSGNVNFVAATRNLHDALCRHLDRGNIPAHSFRAWQLDSYADAVRFADRRIVEYEPYYNVAG